MSHEGLPKINPEKATADLRMKVETANKAKEESIVKNLKDREQAILELKGNKKSLDEARGVSKYFESVQNTGGLPDVEEAKKFEDVKELVGSLESHGSELNKKIDEISGNPEILGRLQDEANSVESHRESLKMADQFYARMDKFSKDLGGFIEGGASVIREIEKLGKVTEKIVESLRNANNSYTKNAERLPRYWDPIWDSEEDREKMIQLAKEISRLLLDDRQSIRGISGMFKGKEKAEIDSVLDKVEEYINTLVKQGELSGPLYSGRDSLVSQYREIEKDKESSGLKYLSDSRYGLEAGKGNGPDERLKLWIKDSVKK